VQDVFWAAHEGLPRESPGSDATARLLLQLAGPLPERPRVVDIGAGTGPASLLLACELGARVTAVDTHAPFLARLRTAADAAGLTDWIRTVEAPMQDLPLPDASADLIWAEGSAYIMGVDAALVAWRRLLAPNGVLVLTDATWTTPDPAPDAHAFWETAYPAMRTADAVVAAAQRAGWTLLGSYLLPDSDWDAYYGPLAARITELRAQRPEDAAALDAEDLEIEARRRYGDDYGYTGFVLRRR
jgi:SAM-dependent methyltransferase